MISINGVKIRTPSSFQWGLQDLSSENSGRTQDGIAHKDRIAQKRKLSCGWNGIRREDAAVILQAVNADIFMEITYPDAMSGKDETRTFYVGDRTAQMHSWTVDNKLYNSISFDFIER